MAPRRLRHKIKGFDIRNAACGQGRTSRSHLSSISEGLLQPEALVNVEVIEQARSVHFRDESSEDERGVKYIPAQASKHGLLA